jgi:two-component system response regulator AtoC
MDSDEQGQIVIPSEVKGTIPDDIIQTPLHEELLGESESIREVCDMVERLASSDLTVLITGESGTGKDITARLLHRHSPRHQKPFVKVNCPAVPEGIIESELFGYERGAFTGARSSKPGRLELANHGTIFLDEAAEIPYHIQGKLLQVLDGEPVMRIGGTTEIKTDVRIIAATNMVLEEAVRNGRMREDIYFRLSQVVIEMPALRDRPEDIPLLAEHFNFNFCTRFDKQYAPLPGDALHDMCGQEWPGNVRELAARVKKYVATDNVQSLLTAEPPSQPSTKGHGQAVPARSPKPREPRAAAGVSPPERQFPALKEATKRAVEATERALIEQALQYTLWNRRKAAKLLDISYSSLLRRIDAYGIGKPKSE